MMAAYTSVDGGRPSYCHHRSHLRRARPEVGGLGVGGRAERGRCLAVKQAAAFINVEEGASLRWELFSRVQDALLDLDRRISGRRSTARDWPLAIHLRAWEGPPSGTNPIRRVDPCRQLGRSVSGAAGGSPTSFPRWAQRPAYRLLRIKLVQGRDPGRVPFSGVDASVALELEAAPLADPTIQGGVPKHPSLPRQLIAILAGHELQGWLDLARDPFPGKNELAGRAGCDPQLGVSVCHTRRRELRWERA